MSEHANALEIIRDRDNRAFVAADSLASVFSDMADTMAGGPIEATMRSTRTHWDLVEHAAGVLGIAS